ncbi:hypothetical protein MMC17_002939 [Xylographa soralifera]|nr:hypothetical protein [Xylographa soralifera]
MASTTTTFQRWTADITPYLLYLITIVTLGPLQFGFHLAELNAPEAVIRCIDQPSILTAPSLPTCIPMTSGQFSVVSSIYTIGGLLGALTSGPLTTKYGRVLPMRLGALFFIVGPILSSLAPSIPVIALGRFISGIGAGAAIVVVPIYISEISPKESKGLFGALTQITINVGILVSQVLGYFLSYGNMWRVVLGTAGGIALVQGLGLVGVCESPSWLVTTGKTGQAKRMLESIRGGDIQEEVGKWGTAQEGQGENSSVRWYLSLAGQQIIKSTVRINGGADEYDSLLRGEENNQSTPPTKRSSEASIGILKVIVHPDHYRAIIAVIGVMLAQQLCGINSVIMYSVSFLRDLLPTTAGIITIGVGALNLVMTIACAPLSDRLGRKTCLLLSIAGMGSMSLMLGFALLFGVQILAAVATLLIVASFAVGLGPIPFILANELVGPEAVGATQSLALSANWIATFLVAQFFPILSEALDQGRVFFLFAGLAVVFFAFVSLWVPETQGKKDADEVWGRHRRED